MISKHRLCVITSIVFVNLNSFAGDSVEIDKHYDLKEFVVESARTKTVAIDKGDKLHLDLQGLEGLPKFLGSADPMHYIKTLPGIQTGNELSSGINIHGCEDYQNIISINGAPIYYPVHLLGLFSSFIPEHFSDVIVEKSNHKANFAERIGGSISFITQHSDLPKWNIHANVGLLESDISAGVPIKKGHNLFMSTRVSYITLLYKKLLSINSVSFDYDFQDFNLTYAYNGEKDNVVVTTFFDRDKFNIDEKLSLVKGYIKWGNSTSSVNWKHCFNSGTLDARIYFSGSLCNLDAGDGNTNIRTNANVASCGLHATYSNIVNDHMNYSVGTEYSHAMALPIKFDASNMYISDNNITEQHANSLNIFADFNHSVCNWFNYSVGLNGGWYNAKNYNHLYLDPRATFNFNITNNHSIQFHYGLYHQNIHKTGLTNIGLPTDFYFLSDKKFKPEKAHSLSLSWAYNILNGKYSVSIETYFKQLYNVVTSRSNIFNLFTTGFDYSNDITYGNGRNYGIDIMFSKRTGIITGYVSYSFGRALRMFYELGQTSYKYPADHERIHDLNVVINARINKHWSVGGTFVLCTGTPYTRAESAYIVNGTVICKYGDYNAANLPLYHRLDLSASYYIINKDGKELAINLSLFNVYAHKNVQFVFYSQSASEIQASLLGTIIPSISIFMNF